MDIPPTRLIRLLQLGDSETALRAGSIWQCVSCQTCTTRCPKRVDCAAVMDALRQLAFERGTASPAERRTVLFCRSGRQQADGASTADPGVRPTKPAGTGDGTQFFMRFREPQAHPNRRHKLNRLSYRMYRLKSWSFTMSASCLRT
jgi:Fe-S oxidoreductase